MLLWYHLVTLNFSKEKKLTRQKACNQLVLNIENAELFQLWTFQTKQSFTKFHWIFNKKEKQIFYSWNILWIKRKLKTEKFWIIYELKDCYLTSAKLILSMKIIFNISFVFKVKIWMQFTTNYKTHRKKISILRFIWMTICQSVGIMRINCELDPSQSLLI